MWAVFGRIVAVLLIISAIAGTRLQAQDADALQAANELLSLLSPDLVKQLAHQVIAQAWPSLERQLRASSAAITDDSIAALREEFERIQIANLAAMLKEWPAIYARHFTASELHDLIAFYHTPTGQKALRELPQVTAEALRTVMPRIPQIEAQTIEAFKKILRQRGYAI